MRPRALLGFLMVCVLLPAASAQTSVGEVETSVEPARITVDPQADRQEVSVHVTGEIQCTPGTAPPAPVQAEPDVKNRKISQGGQSERIFAFEPETLEVPWQSASGQPGGYVIDEEVTVRVVSDTYNVQPEEVKVQWVGQFIGGDGTDCAPNGYGWNVDSTGPLTLVLRSGPPLPDGGDGGGDGGTEATPGPALPLVLAALGVAAMLRRRR